jgi:hypothetical protein
MTLFGTFQVKWKPGWKLVWSRWWLRLRESLRDRKLLCKFRRSPMTGSRGFIFQIKYRLVHVNLDLICLCVCHDKGTPFDMKRTFVSVFSEACMYMLSTVSGYTTGWMVWPMWQHVFHYRTFAFRPDHYAVYAVYVATLVPSVIFTDALEFGKLLHVYQPGNGRYMMPTSCLLVCRKTPGGYCIRFDSLSITTWTSDNRAELIVVLSSTVTHTGTVLRKKDWLIRGSDVHEEYMYM